MYERSGSQFFTTITEIQSGRAAFDESRIVMTFSIIFGVSKILCSFRLVLERKTSNFTLSDAKDNASGPMSRAGIAGLPWLRTILAIHQKF